MGWETWGCVETQETQEKDLGLHTRPQHPTKLCCTSKSHSGHFCSFLGHILCSALKSFGFFSFGFIPNWGCGTSPAPGELRCGG